MGIVDNKEIFLMTAAMGLETPMELHSPIDGLSQYTVLKTEDRALIACVLLGLVSNDEELNEYADFDRSEELCEKCAESGYQILQKKYNESGCDNEMFERRLVKELEFMYTKNVENNI